MAEGDAIRESFLVELKPRHGCVSKPA